MKDLFHTLKNLTNDKRVVIALLAIVLLVGIGISYRKQLFYPCEPEITMQDVPLHKIDEITATYQAQGWSAVLAWSFLQMA